jgi:hypothetical protein
LGWLGKPQPSDPDDISESHPDGQASCNRASFERGKRYVLFLTRYDLRTGKTSGSGEFIFTLYPFSRVAEDYSGEDSLWVRTVRRYVDIQARYAPMEQFSVLEALLEEKQDRLTVLTQAEAKDILDYLIYPSPFKPTAHLLGLYERLERGEMPKRGLREIVSWLSTPASPQPPPLGIEQAKDRVLISLADGDHPDAVPLFDRLMDLPRPSPKQMSVAISYFAKHKQWPRAFKLIEAAFGRLPSMSFGEGMDLLYRARLGQMGDPYQQDDEPWRTDPATKTAWPELALKLYWFQFDTYGQVNEPFREAIEAIALEDYRARPELTLARAGSEDVKEWVLRALTDELKQSEWGSPVDDKESSVTLPVAALVLGSYGQDRSEMFEQLVCHSAPARDTLIKALGRWGDRFDARWLGRIAVTPGISDPHREGILTALDEIYSRDQRYWRVAGHPEGGNTLEYESMKRLIASRKLEYEGQVRPIACPK